MKNLTYILLILGFTILTSCEKEKNSSVEGYFYKDCSQTPIEPTVLKVYGNTTASFRPIPEELVGEVITDKIGCFRFEYNYY